MSSTTVVPGFAWSYSALKNFTTCPKRYYHYQVAKDVKEPETAELREGNALHAAFEARLKGTPLPLGYAMHEPLLASIIDAPGVTYGEQKLALTSAFQPVAFFGRGVWFRTVADVVKDNGTWAFVGDYKTGKPKDDLTQLQLMAATLFAHKPELQRVRAALLFVNHAHAERAEFLRTDLPEMWSEILPRVKEIERARQTQEYPPKPSGLCKRYCAVLACPYHGKGG